MPYSPKTHPLLRRDFISWLQKTRLRSTFKPKDCSRCPIATFIKAKLRLDVSVGGATYSLSTSCFSTYVLPKWAQVFISAYDNSGGDLGQALAAIRCSTKGFAGT